jgi:hypothetical protein
MLNAMKSTDVLDAYLWDLRAQAESKLRCLTRVQQMVNDYGRKNADARGALRTKILADLTDVVTISTSLSAVSRQALDAARALDASEF